MTDSDKNRAVPVSREVLDELQRDAERYRWLCNKVPVDILHEWMEVLAGKGVRHLNAAIDAAMVMP